MTKSDITPLPRFFDRYINLAPNIDLIDALTEGASLEPLFPAQTMTDLGDYRYAPGKWAAKDILQHLIDAERIFAYRALRFSRNDTTPLASFDENEYVVEANANRRSIQELLTELAVVRQSTLSLFKTFSEQELLRTGIASKNPMSVRALGFVIIGHQNHHQRIFEVRYL